MAGTSDRELERSIERAAGKMASIERRYFITQLFT